MTSNPTNPRYEEFLRDLRDENLVEEVLPRFPEASDAQDALRIFGDEFVVVASLDRAVPTACAPGDFGATANRAERSDSQRSDDGPPTGFSFSGLGKESVLVRHQTRKRAVGEVNGLQMVDHVLCAAEREQKKIVPHPHDALHLKQALHELIEALSSEDLDSIAEAEARFIEETQKLTWELLEKDSRLTVSEVRRYMESTRPALSTAALNALARFYRNAPFSYQVRDKFELVMTRLFCRETLGDRRTAIYPTELIARNIGHLYAEWESLKTYGEDDSFEVSEAVNSLESFSRQAEGAATFEELIADDFFTRLRAFKEGLHEEFFSPAVTAAAVECNVVVGNRFIELLEKERRRDSIETIGEKFAEVCSEDVSEMTGKTIDLAEKLCGDKRKAERIAKARSVQPAKPKRGAGNGFKAILFVGGRLVAIVAIVLLSAAAIYFGTKRMILENSSPAGVKRVNLENSVLREYIQGATISGETFVGTINPAWDALEPEQKSEAVNRVLSIGASKGFKYVRLVDPAGKTVASGTPNGIDVR